MKENAARPVRGSFTARRVTGEKASGIGGKTGPNAGVCEERDCAVAQQAIAAAIRHTSSARAYARATEPLSALITSAAKAALGAANGLALRSDCLKYACRGRLGDQRLLRADLLRESVRETRISSLYARFGGNPHKIF